MLTIRMSLDELKMEILSEMQEIVSKIEMCEKKVRRVVLKTTRFPIYLKPVEFVTKRKNKWIILFEGKSKKNAEKPLSTCICTMQTNSGVYAIMLCVRNDETGIIMFPPHFFHRYRERFLKSDFKGNNVIEWFFRYNPSFVFDNIDDVINASCTQGVCLGKELAQDVVIFKTFLTYDMLKGRQIITHELLSILLSVNEREMWGVV